MAWSIKVTAVNCGQYIVTQMCVCVCVCVCVCEYTLSSSRVSPNGQRLSHSIYGGMMQPTPRQPENGRTIEVKDSSSSSSFVFLCFVVFIWVASLFGLFLTASTKNKTSFFIDSSLRFDRLRTVDTLHSSVIRKNLEMSKRLIKNYTQKKNIINLYFG